MSVCIELSLDDVRGLWHTGCAAEGLADGAAGRFEMVSPPEVGEHVQSFDRDPVAWLEGALFVDGSLLWCDSYLSALLLAKVHRAYGERAHMLWDMAEVKPGEPWGHCVLTTWSITADQQ
jgi:hypothetical protein